MSTWDERALERANLFYPPPEDDHVGRKYSLDDLRFGKRDAFIAGADWQREALLSEETVMRAARACFDIRDDAYDDRGWGELDSQERELYLCQARAALTAALGDQE